MSDNLRQKTKNGLIWSTVENFSTQGVSFIFSIILARLLCPSDYGIVAMTGIFFSIARAFVESGFGSALIRKKDRKDIDFSTCFYFNMVVSLFFYVIFFISAPMIASFYDQPILISIVRVEALNIIFGAFCIVQQSKLTIEIDFKTQAKISLSSIIISGIIGILFAYLDYGVWALVWQGISSSIMYSIMLCVFVRWRPRCGFSKESFHYLFGYGSKLLASGLLDTTYNNIYPLVIGKFYTPAQLGNFSRAQSFAQLPSSNITRVLQRVTFPVLSEIQDDMERLETNYRKLLKMSAFIIFPLMMGLAAVANPLINVVLTAKWEQCVIYLQIFCFSMMWYPIHAINLNLLQVKGRSDLFLRLEIIKKIVGACIMCVTIPMGVLFMCYGMVVSSLISLIINTYYTGKLIKVGYIVQMKDLLPIFLCSVLMGVIVFFCIQYIFNYWLQLIIGILIGIFCYIGFTYIFAKEELLECKMFIKNK